MKKTLKIIGLAVGLLLVAVISFALFVQFSGIPTYETPEINYVHQSSPAAVARGKKLVSMLCAGCHRDHTTGKITGSQMLDAPAEFGVIYSKNITQDKTHGIGDWTDAELMYLLRTGIGRDGKYIPPYMAKLPHMADSDINAIIAFLRSDDPMVAADPTPDQDSEVSFLTKLLSRLAWKPMPLPEAPIALPDSTDRLAMGRYIAWNFECFSCHSADFKTNDFAMPDQSAGYFGGGNPTLNKKGQVIATSNLTPHETGIGNWTRSAFIQSVKYGTREGQAPLRFPMMPYALLSDSEVGALYDYLQTVPAIDNKVERVFYH